MGTIGWVVSHRPPIPLPEGLRGASRNLMGLVWKLPTSKLLTCKWVLPQASFGSSVPIERETDVQVFRYADKQVCILYVCLCTYV